MTAAVKQTINIRDIAEKIFATVVLGPVAIVSLSLIGFFVFGALQGSTTSMNIMLSSIVAVPLWLFACAPAWITTKENPPHRFILFSIAFSIIVVLMVSILVFLGGNNGFKGLRAMQCALWTLPILFGAFFCTYKSRKADMKAFLAWLLIADIVSVLVTSAMDLAG